MFEGMATKRQQTMINIEIISTSSIRISCVVRSSELERAVQVVHDRFRLSENVLLLHDATGETPPAV